MIFNFIWNPAALVKRKKALANVHDYIDKAVVEKMTPYVPVALERFPNSGKLRDSVKITQPGTIVYTAPFARQRYYDRKEHPFTANPLGRGFWFEYMKKQHKAEIEAGANEIMARESR